MLSDSVNLTFYDDPPKPDCTVVRSWAGFMVEDVRIYRPRGFSYTWQGDGHYLALHDIKLADGEIDIDGEAESSRLDLRNCLTFVPQGARVSGWSQLDGLNHGFFTIVFDPHLAEAEIERPLLGIGLRPLLYFEHAELTRTLRRMQLLIRFDEEKYSLRVETLGLLAVLQSYPSFGRIYATAKGHLSPIQQQRVEEFIDAHLSTTISLEQLAAVAELSRFHFARSFSRTYGRSPHQHVLAHRIGRAASLLANSDMPVFEVAARTGFSSQARLSTAFRRMIGRSPRQFRSDIG